MVLVTKKQKTPPIHHQKRHGQHHKHTKPYEKTYWPYLPLLAIVGVTMAINLAWSGLAASTSQVLGTSTGITQDSLLIETNQDRHAEHAGSLTLDTHLASAAQAKAQDMASRNYWAHTSPQGTSPWDFINESGYSYQSAGENLAYGFANSDQVLRGWMNSREHRSNMLNSAYQNVGFGVAHAQSYQGKADQTIVVAMYGKPLTVAGSATQTTGNQLPAKQVVRLELYAGNALPGALFMLVCISTAAAAIIVFRHSRFAHRAFVYSEAFIVHHPLLDVAMISIAAAGVILSRTAGFIH